MLKQIRLNDAVGKVLTKADTLFEGSIRTDILLIFDDQYMVLIGAKQSYDEEMVAFELDLIPTNFDDRSLIRCKIATKEEIEKLRAEHKKQLKEKKYRQYLALKAEFENNE